MLKHSDINYSDINYSDKNGYTELMYASESKSLSEDISLRIVKILIEKGVNINLSNNEGDTALILASRNYHPHIVEHLLKASANIDIKNNSGKTAMDVATEYEHKEIINLIYKYGNRQDIIHFG